MAIKKAFGWSNLRLLGEIAAGMGELIVIGLFISTCVLIALVNWREDLFSINVTPLFVIGTVTLLLLTLIISTIIPFAKITKIRPAEVIS